MPMSRYIVVAVADSSSANPSVASPAVEPTEPKMAVGDKGGACRVARPLLSTSSSTNGSHQVAGLLAAAQNAQGIRFISRRFLARRKIKSEHGDHSPEAKVPEASASRARYAMNREGVSHPEALGLPGS